MLVISFWTKGYFASPVCLDAFGIHEHTMNREAEDRKLDYLELLKNTPINFDNELSPLRGRLITGLQLNRRLLINFTLAPGQLGSI